MSDPQFLPKLLPRPEPGSSGPPGPGPSSDPPLNKRAIPAACNTCKRRKLKCHGERPACSRCQRSRIACQYSVPEGLSVRQADKRKLQELESTESRLQAVLKLLHDDDGEDDSTATLKRIKEVTKDLFGAGGLGNWPSNKAPRGTPRPGDLDKNRNPPSTESLSSHTLNNQTYTKSKDSRGSDTRMACLTCRSRGVECDQQRPRCFQCLQGGYECGAISENDEEPPSMLLTLEMKGLRKTLFNHTLFLEHLVSLPDSEALTMVKLLKSTGIPDVVLSSAEGSTESLYRPSGYFTSRSNLPPTQSNIEFELMMLHRSMYRIIDPLSISQNSNTESAAAGAPVEDKTTSALHPEAASSEVKCDSRLEGVEFSYWTSISIDSNLVALIISHYFEVYHAIFGFFDADCFLSDLVNCKLNFCSPFLFHAFMALACQSYSSLDIRASSYSLLFLAQAMLFRETEQSTDSATNLSALNLLSVAAAWNGDDVGGNLEIPAAIRAQATRMGLLDTAYTSDIANSLNYLPPDQRTNMAHVAWGSYGWLTMLAQYHPKNPIKHPPSLPIPDKRNNNTQSLNQPHVPLPDYLGSTFSSLCRFWVLAQEIDVIYNLPSGKTLVGRIPPAFAESKYQSLLTFADTLPGDMALHEKCASHVYLFHALYHIKVLDIFRPFLNPSKIITLRSFSSPDSTSSAIFAASLKQLKHLIVAYRTRLPSHLSRACIFAAAVLHVSSVVVKKEHTSRDPSWRFYFDLCFGYWKDAYVNYRMMHGLVEAHLTLAMQEGALTWREAETLLHEFRMVGRHHDATMEVLTSCILDFGLGIEMQESARADELARRFEDVVLFDKWIDGNYGNDEEQTDDASVRMEEVTG